MRLNVITIYSKDMIFMNTTIYIIKKKQFKALINKINFNGMIHMINNIYFFLNTPW